MKEFKFENGSHIKSSNLTAKMMRHLIIALLPIIVFSFYKNGVIPYQQGFVNIIGLFRPLLMIILASLASLLSEVAYYKFILKGKDVKDFLSDSFALIPGLFLALIVPLNTPYLILIVGAMLASIVGKMIYGGFGHNIFNPALIGRLLIFSAYGVNIMSAGGYLNPAELDTIAKATPLTNLKTLTTIGSYETLVAPYGSLMNFFLGTIPGSMGETSALLILVAFVYLTFNKIIKWTIPVVYVATVFVMTYLIGNASGLGLWFPLFHILSGGLMFGAVFMATDPVTSPVTPIGQVIYGLFLGILTVVFRFLTPEPEGVLTSILTMNMFIYLIDKTGMKARFEISKMIIPIVTAWVLIVSLGFYIASTYDVPAGPVVDNNFKVISKDITDDKTTYVVTQKGYVGPIKGQITIVNGSILSIDIVEQNESFYQTITDANYIATLLMNRDNLSEVDTVSGATFTSTALREMLINTLEDYNEK